MTCQWGVNWWFRAEDRLVGIWEGDENGDQNRVARKEISRMIRLTATL